MKILYADIGTVNDLLFDKWKNEVSDYRRKKAEALRFENDRKLSLAAGKLLASLLAEYGIDEGSCTYETAEHGKLRLAEYPELSFNISHSGQIAVAVICPPDVTVSCGVDVEQIQRARHNVAKRFFSDQAYEHLCTLPTPEADVYFMQIWTRMEAYGKCLGTGLDFTDPLQKNGMDDELMRAHGFYFHEYQITDHSGSGYIITACVNDRKQTEGAQLCLWSD